MNIGELTDLSSGYEIILPLNIFKTKLPSLLIKFIMTIDGKYKNSYLDISRCQFILGMMNFKSYLFKDILRTFLIIW